MRGLALTFALLALTAARPAVAQPCGQAPDTLILLDRSGSMKESAGAQTKWTVALNAVNSVASTFSGQLHFGLMLFSRWPHVSNCSSGKVNVNVGANTAGAIASLLASAYPEGDTPIALSLDEARVYLKGIASGKPQYVILVTDGKETCQPVTVNSPPDAAGKLLGNGVKTYVVGFGAGVDPVSLNATAAAGGTGSYYQADNLTQLNAALKKIAAVISCCGDGKIDPGEACDTAIPAGAAGACPTACNDGNPCTQDLVVGAGCSASCSYVAVTTPQGGDGCCPPGASSATDSDCPAGCGNGVLDVGESCDTGIPPSQSGGCPITCDDGNPCTQDSVSGTGCDAKCNHVNVCPQAACGNGKVDPGEWCDTAIASGPGACPKSCDDGIACTADVMMGSGCIAKCTNLPITSPKNGDGCCPPGATSATDSDCSSTCGNGVVDAGESCDPAIPIGATGACKKECGDGDPCTVDFVGGSACNPSCQHAPIPPNPTKKDSCCPAGMTLAQDADCKEPCNPDKPGTCTDPCEGVQCQDGEYCELGKCVPWPADPGTGGEGGPAGCDCRLPSERAPSPGALLLGLALVLGLALRRRPR